MRSHLRRPIAAVVVALAAALLQTARASARQCADCVTASYWPIAADEYLQQGRPWFPEQEMLDRSGRADLGVAFSGGGTRSASATLGSLHALIDNGWLPQVSYISAVSGGAWTAIPFTYALRDTRALLGGSRAPECLTYRDVTTRPSGDLARAIANSSLASAGIREAASLVMDRRFGAAVAGFVSDARGLLRAAGIGNKLDRTFSRMLGTTFIDPLIPGAASRRFSWEPEWIAPLVSERPTLNYVDFTMTNTSDRPYLIVGATLVDQGAAGFPRLAPVEYTPIYSGIRQRHSPRIGGTYVSSWAYGYGQALWKSFDGKREGKVTLMPLAGQPLSLSDLAASTGAAPQLFFLLAPSSQSQLMRKLGAVAGFFPSFDHWTVSDTQQIETLRSVPHGDGGFTDNLALMPLLARQVRNVLVYVNSNKEFSDNADLESYFRTMREQSSSGDRTMNHVFDEGRLAEVRAGLSSAVRSGGPAIYCAGGWKVLSNRAYNIRGYDGLNICWIYNHDSRDWRDRLPRDVDRLVSGQDPSPAGKNLLNFPWYATFEQNKPKLIKLSVAQTNLLADLAWWNTTNQKSVAAITRVMGAVLPSPTMVRNCSTLEH